MPAFSVSADISINANLDRVRDALCDYNTWPVWSPWLYLERDAHLNFQGSPSTVGHGYDWSGNRVGAGKMSLRSIESNRIESDLYFLKPFKSYADIAFDVNEGEGDCTHVTWHMSSSLPFFMFFMVSKMEGMIKGDYTRGLRMLKDYIETDCVNSASKVEGVVSTEPQTFVGIEDNTTMSNISDSMAKNFPQAYNKAVDGGGSVVGAPFAIYHKVDFSKGSCHYTVAMPVAAGTAGSQSIPAHKALKVVHTGPYRHLGNAWSMGMSEIQHTKIKAHKKIAPYECYINDPENTPEEELITEIYIPLK